MKSVFTHQGVSLCTMGDGLNLDLDNAKRIYLTTLLYRLDTCGVVQGDVYFYLWLNPQEQSRLLLF